MAGGTGGHIFPGIAIGKALQADANSRILWLGSKGGMEEKIISTQTNFTLSLMTIQGFRQKSFFKKILVPFYFLLALRQAVSLFKKHKPDCVIGMGGFVCGPGGLAAWLLNIPLYIHEQNSIPGLTNKLLSRFAQKIFTGFPNAADYFKKHSRHPENVIFTGNPVREDILQLPEKTHVHHPIRLLVIGGSRGATILNELLPKAIEYLPDSFALAIYHQTGKNQTAEYHLTALNNQTISVTTAEFIDNIAERYHWADIIVCRSGALTLAEIANIGIPAILIPYPYAVDDHQTVNAKYLCDQQAAVLLPQSTLTPKILADTLQQLCEPEHYSKMAKASRALRQPNAIESIIERL